MFLTIFYTNLAMEPIHR